VPGPVQAPDQPAKAWLAPGVAVRVTLVPEAYDSVQSAPQLMPAGTLVIVPEPVTEVVRVNVGAAVTVTVVELSVVPPAPVQLRVYVVVTVKAPVDWLPDRVAGPVKPAVQEQEVVLVELQVIVEELPEAIEAGEAPIEMVGAGIWLNVAATLLASDIVRTQGPVPVQAPDQPAKVWLDPGEAVKVTLVPEVYAALQTPDVQLMPAGELVIVPVPITEVDSKNDSVFAIDIIYIVSRVTPALVAITATLYIPTGVLALVIIFKVELQRGLQLVGEKVATAPVGKPEAEKDTS